MVFVGEDRIFNVIKSHTPIMYANIVRATVKFSNQQKVYDYDILVGHKHIIYTLNSDFPDTKKTFRQTQQING